MQGIQVVSNRITASDSKEGPPQLHLELQLRVPITGTTDSLLTQIAQIPEVQKALSGQSFFKNRLDDSRQSTDFSNNVTHIKRKDSPEKKRSKSCKPRNERERSREHNEKKREQKEERDRKKEERREQEKEKEERRERLKEKEKREKEERLEKERIEKEQAEQQKKLKREKYDRLYKSLSQHERQELQKRRQAKIQYKKKYQEWLKQEYEGNDKIPKPAPLKPSFFFTPEAANKYKRLVFFPKNNLTDRLYSIVENTYAVVSYNSASICNCRPCPDDKISFIRFKVINDDCLVGLTVNSRDTLKYYNARKNLMMYNFKLNTSVVGISEKSYEKVNATGKEFVLVIDPISNKMRLLQENRIVCSEAFTDYFKTRDIYVMIKLGEYGKVQML